MFETSDEIAELQEILDRSHGESTGHLRSIIGPERTLRARDIVSLMTGMKVLSVATVTARGEPRISALDGHFLHATWTFTTSGTAAKARHIARRPAVSIAHIDNEEVALFAHGEAQTLHPGEPLWDETLAHWTSYYDSSPLSWGDDIRVYRFRPQWMVGYTGDREKLLRDRGIMPT
jgi:general stress protein 26